MRSRRTSTCHPLPQRRRPPQRLRRTLDPQVTEVTEQRFNRRNGATETGRRKSAWTTYGYGATLQQEKRSNGDRTEDIASDHSRGRGTWGVRDARTQAPHRDQRVLVF